MRFLRLAVPGVEEVAGSVTCQGTGLQIRTGLDSWGRGYLEATTFLEPPPNAGEVGMSHSLHSLFKRQGLGTEP